MNIKQLEYFLAAAQSRTLSEAAARVFITQPALSSSLVSLERELNISLFAKQKTGMTLTAAGLDFFQYAKQTLALYEKMNKLASEQEGDFSGNVKIYAVPSLHTSLLLDVQKEIFHNYPNIYLEILSNDNCIIKNEKDEIVISLLIRQIDKLDQAWSDIKKNFIEYEELGEVECFIYINSDNPISKEEYLELGDLKKFYLAQNQKSDIMYSYNEILQYFSRDMVYRFSYNEALLDLIRENPNMIGLYSAMMSVHPRYGEKLCFKRINNFPMPTRYIMASSYPEAKRPVAEKVKNAIRYFFDRYAGKIVA